MTVQLKTHAWMRVFLAGLASACCLLLVVAVSASADFGIEPGSLSTSFVDSDGVAVVPQASSHPYEFTISFKMNRDSEGNGEGGEIRDVLIDLPKGLSGNPLAVPRCTRQDFEGSEPKCSPNTQVGSLQTDLFLGQAGGPIYNLVPPPGMAAQLGFSVYGDNALQNISVLDQPGYPVHITTNDVPHLEITAVTATVWGDPANPGHDSLRGAQNAAGVVGAPPIPSTAPDQAFLTLPANCDAPLETTVEVDSTLDPGHYVSATAESLDSGGAPSALLGCGAVPFNPSVAAQPTTRNAGSPSGLDFELALPDEGLLNPNSISETQPSKVRVALPAGMTANPSFAEGITDCSASQYAAEQLRSAPGAGCPEMSKLGSVIAHSPAIEEPIEGSLYLASPYENQFGSLLAIYMVLRAPERGLLIKQAGHVEPDPITGQLVTTFEGLPPLPYSMFHLHFREGARAPLATPSTCGQYRTVNELTAFSSSVPVERDSFFTIEHGPDGGACPAGGTPPFKPGLEAGTTNNAAGAYSPMELRITRKDGEQEVTGFTTQLPEGLTANLTGVPFCTETDIALARTKTGAAEQASPSCPTASQIGHSQVGVGVGTVLAYAPGVLYLGGPFEGAPFSLVSISAAKVGPFDLGTVVVHLPLDVDPITARVSIPQGVPDQIPHIIKGIVVHVRDIQVSVDREHFTINPTSCEHKTLSATVYGSGQNFTSPTDDVPATTTSPFQAADCASLQFKPGFSAATTGKTSRKNGASLKVTLTYPNLPQGTQANIHNVHVELPRALPSRLNTLNHACPAATFNQNPASCSPQSRVGYAKATTPILPVPLEGPAYFVSHGGAQFPELIVVLQGDGVTVDLAGETFINEKTSITSSTFKQVPDVPVGTFELNLPQGEYSALGANTNLCTTSLIMPTTFTGQNGMTLKQNTPINVENCPYTLQVISKATRKRTATLHVAVPAAGRLVATGAGVSRAVKSAGGRSSLTIHVSERRAGKLHTKIRLRFTPSNGKQRKILTKTVAVAFH